MLRFLKMNGSTLLAAFREPQQLGSLTIEQWNLLLKSARRTELLSRLACRVGAGTAAYPARIRDYVASGHVSAVETARAVRWEIEQIHRALVPLSARVILLKGAAYYALELPISRGRFINDIDILVPRDELQRAEQQLRAHGWQPMKSDDYDDFYYRQWMHELPPLKHVDRQSVIDVHHTILPPTGRLHPNPKLLIEAVRPTADGRFFVLAPEDMVLHAAAHMFQDGELAGALRDLVDLDGLLRHFGETETGFWDRLVPRAEQLQLARPLYYVLRFCERLLGTPVPEAVTQHVGQARPPGAVRRLMDFLVVRALVPPEFDGSTADRELARLLLYIRSHWLRMPPVLLLRHLLQKTYRRWWAKPKGAAQ
jgi:hypothetical protein